MQLKQSQKEQIRNIIGSKLSHSKRGDDQKQEVEENVFDLIERSNFSNRDNLQDKLQAELRDHLKDNAHSISEQISKIIYTNNEGNNNSSNKEEDQENLYKNKFYSENSDNDDDDDDDDDDRRGKRKRNYNKRNSIQQSDLQSDNDNKSLGSDSEANAKRSNRSRRDSYASNSGKRDNKDDKDSSYYNNRSRDNQNNGGKYQNKYNNNNNNNRTFKNDKNMKYDRNNNNNNIMNKKINNPNAAPLPSFMTNPLNPSGMIPNLLGNTPMMNFPMTNMSNMPNMSNMSNNMSNLNLLQPFPNLFTPRMGPPAPPSGKPTISQAGTGAPSLTLSKAPKNIIYVFYIPPKLNNVAKLSNYFTNKFGGVSAYDKIDDTTASIKFEKEDSAKKAVESKEKPFKIEQIVVTFTKSPAPPKPAFVNRNNNGNNNNTFNGGKPTLHNKPSIDGSEPPKQKFVRTENNASTNSYNNNFNNNHFNNSNNNNNNNKPKLQMNFEAKKKQKQFDDSKRLIQLKFADKLKVMIFIKQRETDPESEIRKEVQRCIDQIKQIKDSLTKAQTPEELQPLEQNELIANNYFEFAQKVCYAEGQDMNLTDLRPKLLEFGKVETLKPHLMERVVDIGFIDFQSAEKAYFGLQGQYDIQFVHDHILNFLRNPYSNVEEEEEVQEELADQQQEEVAGQEGEYQQVEGEELQQQQNENAEGEYQVVQQDENNQEIQYYEEEGQEQYQEQNIEDQEQQIQYEEEVADNGQQEYQAGDNQQQIQGEEQVDDDL